MLVAEFFRLKPFLTIFRTPKRSAVKAIKLGAEVQSAGVSHLSIETK